MVLKRNFLSLSRDIVLTLGALAAIAYLSQMLYLDLTGELSFRTTRKVGTIVFKRNSAQRKSSSQAVWEALHKTSPLYNLDTIRTSMDSDARLILDGGIDIALQEETLVVVNTTSRGFDIEFTGGTISSTAQSRMTIRYKESAIVVEEGTDFTLKEAEEGGVNFTVNSGQAQVIQGGKSTQIIENRQAHIEGQLISVSELRYTKRYPKDNALIVSGKKSIDLTFEWNSKIPKKSTKLVLSKTKNFDKQIAADLDSIQLGEGVYYWKLVSDEKESQVYSFEIMYEDAPRVLTPLDKSVLTIFKGSEGKTEGFESIWLNRGHADSYSLIVSDAPGKELVQKIDTLNNSALIKNIGAGEYLLEVEANYSYAAETRYTRSAPVTVTIIESSTPEKARITMPVDGAKLPVSDVNSLGLRAFWNSGSVVDSFLVELLQGDKQLARRKQSQNSTIFKESFSAGTYVLKVTPFAGGITGETTSSSFVVEEDRAVEILSPKDKSSFYPGAEIDCVWSDPGRAYSYRFEIAEDASFGSTIKKIHTTNVSESFKLDKPGIYYMRTQVVGEDGLVLREGKINSFAIYGKLPDPNFTNRYQGDFINVSVSDKFGISWDAIANANEYSIELRKVEERFHEERIESKDVAANSYYISNFKDLTTGRYSFVLTAYQSQDGLRVKVSKTARYYFDLSNENKLQLLTPSEIYLLDE